MGARNVDGASSAPGPQIDRLSPGEVAWRDQQLQIAAILAERYTIATDEFGSDLALHGQPGDILVFPANTVAKRVAGGEEGFVTALHSALVAGIAERRASP
jgi:hypothetical protein